MTTPLHDRGSSDATEQPGVAYRFETFRIGHLLDDMSYRHDALRPGDAIPAFSLPTLDGRWFRSDELGPQPILMVFGSRTCPITESAGPRLIGLHDEFGERVRFVLVNTREAHPGDHFRQPQSMEEKVRHAEILRDHHTVPFEVAVDDIDGTLHRQVSPKPNSAYLISANGIIRYRAHWANDDAALRKALLTVADGGSPPRERSRAMVAPLLRAVGHLPSIVEMAGPKVERDVWRAAPPLALLARLSTALPTVRTDRRGMVVAGSLVGVIIAVGTALL